MQSQIRCRYRQRPPINMTSVGNPLFPFYSFHHVLKRFFHINKFQFICFPNLHRLRPYSLSQAFRLQVLPTCLCTPADISLVKRAATIAPQFRPCQPVQFLCKYAKSISRLLVKSNENSIKGTPLPTRKMPKLSG